ncbi:hypothetical protein AB4234_09700 [Vibrio cyclitrophicus]
MKRLELRLQNAKTRQVAKIIELPSVGLVPDNEFRLLALKLHGLIYEDDIALSDKSLDDHKVLLIHFINQLTRNGEDFDDWKII